MVNVHVPPFGPKLRELREAAGLTQARLAELAGLHLQGIAKLEQGERQPSWPTLITLAAALEVSLAKFAEPTVQQAGPTNGARKGKTAAPAKRPRGRPGKLQAEK